MRKTVWARPLIVALAVAFVLALGLASIGFAAPADSPNDWGCDVCCYGYVVHPGDTLSAIAWRHHVPVYALASYNGIKNANYVRIGQCIKVPPYGYYAYMRYPGQNYCHSCGWDGWGYDDGKYGTCGYNCGCTYNCGYTYQAKPAPKPAPKPVMKK